MTNKRRYSDASTTASGLILAPSAAFLHASLNLLPFLLVRRNGSATSPASTACAYQEAHNRSPSRIPVSSKFCPISFYLSILSSHCRSTSYHLSSMTLASQVAASAASLAHFSISS